MSCLNEIQMKIKQNAINIDHAIYKSYIISILGKEKINTVGGC